MTFLASGLDNLGILDAAVLAGIGYTVVFFGLILLMVLVIVIGKCFTAKTSKPKEEPAAPAAPVVEAVAAPAPVQENLAPGSAGQLKLYDTPPKTAAMLMAIVADKMGKPLNELRFISIKEVK